jgi:uncharacterized protein
MLFLFLIIPVAIYLLLLLFMTLFQSRFVFIPGKTIYMTPDEAGMGFDDLFIEVTAGVSINAWFIPAKNPKGTVLFCHGNAGTMSHRIESAEIFHSLGLNVMLFDYCGYGRSPGKVSEKQTYRDAEAVWKYLVEEKFIPSEKIIIIGRSMGGPIAAKLTKEHKAALCILESTFTSIPEMGKAKFPFFPTKLLVSIKYPTIDYVKEINIPLLIVHSHDDEIIPFRMGREIFASANEPKCFLELSGEHNETYFDCIEKYRGQLETTIGKYLL